MSEPLSTTLKIEKVYVCLHTYDVPIIAKKALLAEGYNRCVDDLDQLSPDVSALAQIMVKKNIEFLDANARYILPEELAQEIINSMNVWIVKKG